MLRADEGAGVLLRGIGNGEFSVFLGYEISFCAADGVGWMLMIRDDEDDISEGR